jgi:hypothetical protein
MVFSISNGAYSPSCAARNRDRGRGRLGSFHRGLSTDNSDYLEFCVSIDTSDGVSQSTNQ